MPDMHDRNLSRFALAGLSALLLIACGGGEPPAPRPQVPAETAAPGAPATGPAAELQDEQASATGGSGSSATHARKRFDLPAVVTPAPADTEPDAPARLHGVARLNGVIPEPKQIAMDHIGGCREHSPTFTQTVLATEEGQLQNVIVYITRGVDRDEVPAAPTEPVELLQQGCVFKPRISVVRSGQTLLIKNEDKTNHNVNIKPSHGSNPVLNRMQPAKAADLELVFPRAEVAIPIGCDIHPWMKAYVAVVDHPYYAVSNELGEWSIELPAGDYLVEAWHERYGTLKGTVEVGPGESGVFEFAFEAAKKKR